MPKPIDLAEVYRHDPRRACRLALRRTAAIPERDRLEAIDRLIGGYGTEAIRGGWQNGYWCDIRFAYVNTGDTYSTTVIHIRGDSQFDRGRFIVSTWGDMVESLERRGERFE